MSRGRDSVPFVFFTLIVNQLELFHSFKWRNTLVASVMKLPGSLPLKKKTMIVIEVCDTFAVICSKENVINTNYEQ